MWSTQKSGSKTGPTGQSHRAPADSKMQIPWKRQRQSQHWARFLYNPSFQFTWGVSCDPTTVLRLILFPPGTMALCGGLLNRNFLCWCKIGDQPSRVEEQRLSFIQTRAKIVYILYNPLEMSVVTLMEPCVNTSLNYLVLPLSLKTTTDKLK